MERSIWMKELIEKFDLLMMTFENRKAVKNGRYREIAEEIKEALHHAAYMEGVFKGIIDLQDQTIARSKERGPGGERRKTVKKTLSQLLSEDLRKKFRVINGGLYIPTVPKGRDDGLTDDFRTWIHEERTKSDHHTNA